MRRSFCEQRDEIESRHDADEFSVVNDRQGPDDVTGHQCRRLAHSLVRGDGHGRMRHRALHRRVAADIYQIAICEQADHVLAVDDDEVADVVTAKQFFSGGGGLIRIDGSDFLAHHVAYSHISSPMSSFQSCGCASINTRISSMQVAFCNTSISTPRDCRSRSSPRNVWFSPMTTRGMPYSRIAPLHIEQGESVV